MCLYMIVGDHALCYVVMVGGSKAGAEYTTNQDSAGGGEGAVHSPGDDSLYGENNDRSSLGEELITYSHLAG